MLVNANTILLYSHLISLYVWLVTNSCNTDDLTLYNYSLAVYVCNKILLKFSDYLFFSYTIHPIFYIYLPKPLDPMGEPYAFISLLRSSSSFFLNHSLCLSFLSSSCSSSIISLSSFLINK